MTKFLELLFLKQLKNIGNATINKEYVPILECINSIDDFLPLVERREKRFSISDLKLALEVAERKYAEIVNTRGIEVITVFDDKYPARLHDLGDKKPVILYARGNTNILSNQSIAVVGTRKPSAWSEMVEQRLVQKILDLSDYVIISGLALGCDGIAHQTTLEANKKTVAVLPSGVYGGDRSIDSHMKTLSIDTNFPLQGKTIFVMDDITTTGHSLRACADVLYNAGAIKVVAIAIAKTF